jgi:hypothetical protein
MTFTWTPEAVAKAAALYGKGTHSAAQIGEMLGTSKGSVIGKMSRAGIVAVRTTCDAPPKPRAPVERKGPAKALYPLGDIPAPIAPAMPSELLVAHGKTITELSPRECRYPLREVAGTHRFCAAPTEPNESYCPACRAIAYAPSGTKQRVGYTPMRRFN